VLRQADDSHEKGIVRLFDAEDGGCTLGFQEWLEFFEYCGESAFQFPNLYAKLGESLAQRRWGLGQVGETL
jgi:hypothetical protein